MSVEGLRNAGLENPQKMPLMIVTESPEVLSKRLNEYRQETQRFLFHFEKFKNNYPELFQKLEEEHSGFKEILNKINQLGQVTDQELTKEEIAKVLSTYNFYAEQVNHVVTIFDLGRKEAQQKRFTNSMNVNMNEFGVELTPEEGEELRGFADEMWNEMFPPSNVDRFMGWVTGQDISKQGKLRWFFAPANGIEMAIMGFVDLFNVQTYTDLVDTVQYMYGMSYEDWCDCLQMLKLAYDNLSTDETINASISVICSLMFLGGTAKIIAKMPKLKGFKKFQKMIDKIRKIHVLEEKLKPLPAAVMGGMYLNFAEHPSIEVEPKKKIKGDTMAG